jgi:hypothetical protein
MTKNRIFLLCFVCSLSLCACDDDDDAVPSANHGVSGSKALNTLSQEEVDRICEDNRERAAALAASSPVIRDSLQLGCTILGLASTLNGGTKAECESNRDECIQSLSRFVGDAGPAPQGQNAISLPCPSAVTLAQCDASVSDLDACTNARLTAYQNIIQEASSAMNAISCNNAGQAFDAGIFTPTGELNIQFEPTDACTSLFQQCPLAVLF